MLLALAVPGTPSAGAAADPCAASEVARTIGSVATSTGIYLDAHPDTNTALTTISQQPAGAQSLGALKNYFDANPQAAKDMQALQSPLVGLSTTCKLPLTLPQVMGLLQGAQSQSPAGALSSPAAQVAPGTGPLPGPTAAVAVVPR
jgi:hemophore